MREQPISAQIVLTTDLEGFGQIRIRLTISYRWER